MFINRHLSMYRDSQLKYLEQVKKELEARQTQVSNISYRKKIKAQQDKENYLTEVHRIRGVLSASDTRLPDGTRDRLENRIKQIKNLKYGAFNAD
jgi:HPt (histidine-containing phosphotransfer) domain-containing protein